MRKCVVLVVAWLPLSGCAGVHLYNADNDALAQSAKKQFEAADLASVVSARQTNLDAFHATDIAQAEQKARARRDLEIVRILNHPDRQTLTAAIDKAEASIGTSSAQGATPGSTTTSDLQRAERDIASRENTLAAQTEGFVLDWHVQPHPCGAQPIPEWPDIPADLANIVKDKSPILKDRLQGDYEAYGAACKDLQKARADEAEKIGSMPSSAVILSPNKIADVFKALQDARGAVNADIAEYEKARSELAAIEADIKKAAPASAPDLNKPLKSLSDALASLQDAAKTLGLGQEAVAQERLDAINAFLDELTKPSATDTTNVGAKTGLSPDLLVAGRLLQTVHTLADKIVAADKAWMAPPISALLIERAHQQALISQAQRTRARSQARLAALQAAFNALVTEAADLRQARLELATVPPTCGAGPAIFACDQHFTTAAVFYVSGVYVGTRAVVLLFSSMLDIDYRMAADKSQFALDAYSSVISTPLDQLAQYHAAGIKPEDLARLFVEAAGLGSIAGRL